jgi:hypothetical protein
MIWMGDSGILSRYCRTWIRVAQFRLVAGRIATRDPNRLRTSTPLVGSTCRDSIYVDFRYARRSVSGHRRRGRVLLDEVLPLQLGPELRRDRRLHGAHIGEDLRLGMRADDAPERQRNSQRNLVERRTIYWMITAERPKL